MSLRIAGGTLKGRIIKTLSGRDTRPTTGRVREAIFSMLQHDIENADVLDVFSGSGALAIEAYSRGANSVTMIEKNRKAGEVIKSNLKSLDLKARLILKDYIKGMKLLQNEGAAFDIILADPPYMMITPDKLVSQLTKYSLAKPGGLLIIEHAGSIVPADERKIKTRRFGDSALSVFCYE